MSREKQIEEMANEICSVCHAYKNCVNTTPCTKAYKEAEELYQDKGYRKQSEVIDDFVKRLKESPIKCRLPLFGLPTKGEIEEYFNDIMLQVSDAIDSIAKEMKGGE